MKIKFSIIVLLTAMSIMYSFNSSERSIPEIQLSDSAKQTDFILGAMSNVFDNTMYDYLSDSLKFNMWHLYAGPVANYGWTYDNGTRIPFDSLGGDTALYGPLIRDRIIQNSQNDLMTLMTRPVVTYFAYGQRSDYQMEESTKVDPYYFFYTYDYSRTNSPFITDIQDNSQYGDGEYVKQCLYDRDSPGSKSGLIVSGLKGNKEQANTFWDVPYLGDKLYPWYIMPRIRIDSAFANDPSKQNVEVCKIVITNWVGDSTIQILQVKNFKKHPDSIYNGDYLEKFFPQDTSRLENLTIPSGSWFNPNQPDPFGHNGLIDFKVYWYDKCDMWIDRIRVENEPARKLITLPDTLRINQLKYEILKIALAMKRQINTKYEPYKFYIEEFEMNHLPCIGYVNKMIKDLTGDSISLMVNYNYDLVRAFIPDRERYTFTADMIKRYLADSAKLTEIFTECYGLEGWEQNDPHAGNSRESYNPPTLNYPNNYDPPNGRLVYKAGSVAAYEDWLQDKFQNGCNGYCQPITFNYIYRLSEEVSRIADIPFIYLLQAHSWWSEYHKLKEPTNEEISLQAYLALAYGAKGILYFAYNSQNEYTDTVQWGRGLAEYSQNAPYPPRYYNAYGQEKWKSTGILNDKIRKLSPYILSFDNLNRKSFIYNIETERINLISQTFFHDVLSYKPVESAFPGHHTNPESASQRYIQVAKFNNPDEQLTRYFMIVNRRCSPFDYSNPDIESGIRFIQIKLDSNYFDFSGFNNWSIYDLENDSLIKTFNKKVISSIDLGWFLPGEGRLYKIAPVMQEGGELVADEVVAGGSFNCNGDVFNNGKNVTISPNTIVNFADGVKWDFTAGEFICGSMGDNPIPLPVTLTSQTAPSRAYWKGITLNQCSNVEIENTVFSYLDNSTTALQLIDCIEFNINHNIFNLTDLDSIIAIGVDYLAPSGLIAGGCGEGCEPDVIYTNAFINNNEFNTASSRLPTLRLSAYTLYVVSLMADRNTFNSTSGSIAVFLSNVAAGNIKNNKIFNYTTGINILSSASYADLYNNTVYGDSIGIQINNGSINLGLQPPNYTGGFNRISANNIYGNPIKTVAGYFGIANGLNTFNFNNDSAAYHLAGTFNISGNGAGAEESAEENCFTLSGGVTTPRENVNCISGLNCEVEFQFDPTVCAITQTDDYFVIDVLGDSTVFDTIWINGGGSGASISNVQLSIRQQRINEMEITGCKDLYNSICIEMRKRNYEPVHAKCMELLNNCIDSTESMDALSKLYLSGLVLDSNGNKISELKTFFETLILQNGDNENLVKKLFYLVQKCKAALGEYESAMDGFQQIINQNPYNYEGLVASWDYAATSLLLSAQGSGGGISNFQLSMFNEQLSGEDIADANIQFSKSNFPNDDPNDKYDLKKFNKEDRKIIREHVYTSFETSQTRESERVKSLETKVTEGKASENEKSELNEKKILKETVKARKPADIAEHIRIVNENINKIFNSAKGKSGQTTETIIPAQYSLFQNYPNPFNPVTRIKFSLPKESSVKLIVYDILGREVKKLVNEKLPMGSYEYEFNGESTAGGLASGIYFYTLQADDPSTSSGQGFVRTRRMVLIK